MSLIQRLLSPIVDVRKEEASALLLMFLYSFLAMTSFNIIKPLRGQRSSTNSAPTTSRGSYSPRGC